MERFYGLLRRNLKRRMTDGFAFGYNIVFPLVLIGVLGVLLRGSFPEQITSYQYYAVVMIPFCTCMGVVTIMYAGKEDAFAKTGERVMMTPVSKVEIVSTKVFAGTLILGGCACLVYAVARGFFGLPGEGMAEILLFYFLLSFAVSGVGTFLGIAMKNFMVLKNVVTIPISILGVMAGVFFRVGSSSLVVERILSCSFLRWGNKALFLAMYDGDGTLIRRISVICVCIGSISMLGAVKRFRKEEYIYGDLPSA